MGSGSALALLGRVNRLKRLRAATAKPILRPSTDAGQLERWRDDPIAFAEDVFGLATWELQAGVLRTVAQHHRVAVRSGHKVGKSLLDAIAALWWATTRPKGGVVLTAPTGRQVKRIVWKEVRALIARAQRRGVCHLPNAPKDPGTGIEWEDGRFIVGFATDEAENMAGWSGPQMLYVVDEASGVDEAIYEAIEGNMAGGTKDDPNAVAKVLLTSNPTRPSGKFFDAFHRERDSWRCFRISSEETPNAQQGRVVIPGLATRDYCEEKRRKWGQDSDLYRVRVRGEFPLGATNTIIAPGLVTEAVERWKTTEPKGDLELGVDVARFGDDDSVIAPRRGPKVFPLRIVHGFDTMQVAGAVLEIARGRLRPPGQLRVRTKVDTIGVGAGVADRLRQEPDIEVVDVNVAEAADDGDDYSNLRTQVAFGVGDFLEEGGAIPDDDDITGELVAPTYSFDARGRRKAEPKDALKKRLGRSPDRFDAIALAIYEGGARYDPNEDIVIPDTRW